MLPIIVITRAWLDAHKFTPKDVAELLDLDLNRAVPAADGPRCPNVKCGKLPTDTAIRLFAPDSSVTPEQAQRVSGRDNVACICGTVYWYPAVHEPADNPAVMTAVRAASVALMPHTGTMQIKAGDVLAIHVHEDVKPRDGVTVQPGPATAIGGTCGPTVQIK